MKNSSSRGSGEPRGAPDMGRNEKREDSEKAWVKVEYRKDERGRGLGKRTCSCDPNQETTQVTGELDVVSDCRAE